MTSNSQFYASKYLMILITLKDLYDWKVDSAALFGTSAYDMEKKFTGKGDK